MCGSSLAGTGYFDEGKHLRFTRVNFKKFFKKFKSMQGKFFTGIFDHRFVMHNALTEQSPGILSSVAFVSCDDLNIQSQDVGLVT